MIGSLHGQLTVNRFFYYATTGPGNVASLLDRIKTNVVINIYGLLSPEFTVVRLEGQRVSPKPLTFLTTLAINLPGTLTGASVPSSVAVVVAKHTNFAGRKYRGRFFFAGIPASSHANSLLTTTAATAWQTFAGFCDDNLTDVDGTQWEPILSHGYVPNTDVLSYTPITQCVASSVLRNQRRRQVGRGK